MRSMQEPYRKHHLDEKDRTTELIVKNRIEIGVDIIVEYSFLFFYLEL